jgi:hypothetical protein
MVDGSNPIDNGHPLSAAYSGNDVPVIIGNIIREKRSIDGALSRLPGQNLNFLVRTR